MRTRMIGAESYTDNIGVDSSRNVSGSFSRASSCSGEGHIVAHGGNGGAAGEEAKDRGG